MKLARFFGRYLRKYAGWIMVAMITIPLYGVASTALVSLIEPIFGEVLQAGDSTPGALGMVTSAPSAGEAGGDEGLLSRVNLKKLADRGYRNLKTRLGITEDNVLYFVPLLFLAVFLVRAVMHFLSGYSFQHIGLGVTNDIRNDLYRRLLEQTSRFHSRHPSGELVSRVVNDVGLIQAAVTNNLLDLLQQSVTLVLLLGLLLSTQFQLALMCLVVTPLVLYPIVRFGKGMRRTSHRSQERMADVASLLSEGVRGHRVVKAFGMEEFEDRRFRAATQRHLRINLWAQMLTNVSSPVIETIGAVGASVLLVYAGLKIRAGELTAPILVQFIANLLLMYDPIRKLNRVNLVLQHALAGAHRVMDLMDVPIEVTERDDAVDISGVREGVGYEAVHFGYGDKGVLRGIDLTLRQGEIVALVGPSGAGKTTLVNLLPRFFDPDSGRVTIDGRDVRDMTLASLRAQIGIVTQETMLFNDTIRNNIAYGRSELSLERVREAAVAAFADDFIAEKYDGYDTVIGEAGSHLSGGQRQRLSIARALLKDAPILILDEATSHLDSESESLIQKALLNLMRDRTTLVVAHRLATVMHADRIVVLDGGRIVEIGTHAELLERGGLYRKLYDLQFEV